MSYVRWGPSSVYVFMNVSGTLTCCGCLLDRDESVDPDEWGQSFDARSTQEMVDHLAAHRAQGDYVPKIEEDLWADDKENFPCGS